MAVDESYAPWVFAGLRDKVSQSTIANCLLSRFIIFRSGNPPKCRDWYTDQAIMLEFNTEYMIDPNIAVSDNVLKTIKPI